MSATSFSEAMSNPVSRNLSTPNFFVGETSPKPIWRRRTAVLRVHNDLVRAVDNNQVSGLVLLDLTSAVDAVDHSTMLLLLSERFCVTNSVLNWFKSYLTGRTQSLSYAGNFTAPSPVVCGVPQVLF
jgi:hypothetical protein